MCYISAICYLFPIRALDFRDRLGAPWEGQWLIWLHGVFSTRVRSKPRASDSSSHIFFFVARWV